MRVETVGDDMTTDNADGGPRPPGSAPGTLAKDVMSNSRIGPLVKAVRDLDRSLRGLGLMPGDATLVITLEERNAMWIEALLVKYTGVSAHTGTDGKPLTPMADGKIRRFRLGMVEFRYVTTI